MPITTTMVEWEPMPSTHYRRALIGSKIIAVGDLPSATSRHFIVWDLDTDTKNAYEISFNGFVPWLTTTHSVAVDSSGLWIATFVTTGYLWLTRCNLDGSYDQWPSTIFVGSSQPSNIRVLIDSGVLYVFMVVGTNTRVITFDLTTLTYGTATTRSGRTSTYPIKYGSKWYGFWSSNCYEWTPASGGHVLVGNAGGTVEAGSIPVEFGGYLWWGGSDLTNTVVRLDPTTNTLTRFELDAPWGSVMAPHGDELVSAVGDPYAAPPRLTGWNPSTNERWVESLPTTINRLFAYGSGLVGTHSFGSGFPYYGGIVRINLGPVRSWSIGLNWQSTTAGWSGPA